MAKPFRVLPALCLLGLAMCRDASTVEPAARAPLSARHDNAPDNAPSVQLYRVDFDELNGSGVKARATLQVSDGNLIVTLDANGRVPERVHPQHIHGFTDKVSACPTAANDTNGDGTITFAEGSSAFGPVQVDLLPYPTPENSAGATHFRAAFVANQVAFTLSDLAQKTMVLHGDFFGGSYVGNLPVACGRVEPVN